MILTFIQYKYVKLFIAAKQILKHNIYKNQNKSK